MQGNHKRKRERRLPSRTRLAGRTLLTRLTLRTRVTRRTNRPRRTISTRHARATIDTAHAIRAVTPIRAVLARSTSRTGRTDRPRRRHLNRTLTNTNQPPIRPLQRLVLRHVRGLEEFHLRVSLSDRRLRRVHPCSSNRKRLILLAVRLSRRRRQPQDPYHQARQRHKEQAHPKPLRATTKNPCHDSSPPAMSSRISCAKVGGTSASYFFPSIQNQISRNNERPFACRDRARVNTADAPITAANAAPNAVMIGATSSTNAPPHETPTHRACTMVPNDNADRLRDAPDACVANSSM